MSERLRELAEAATPGPWYALIDDHELGRLFLTDDPSGSQRPLAQLMLDDVGRYVEAVSPDVVLRLLRIEEAARRYVDAERRWLEAGVPPGLGSEADKAAAALRDALQEDSHVGK